jgi:hypothetical protein
MKHETKAKVSAIGYEPRVVRRTNLLLVVVSLAVVAGLLFPLPSRIFDVLLVFSTSLTAAALIITFSAQQASQVQGFPWLIVLVTTLRVALSVASAKLIFLQGHAGTIVEMAGSLIVRDNNGLTVVIFSVLTAIIFVIICRTAGNINKTGTELAANIIAAGQIGVDGKPDACLINNEQVFILRDDMAREAGFFTGMAGVAKFVLCAAVIELAIISFNTINGLAAGSATMNPTASVKTYLVLSTGIGMIVQISSLLTAVASGYLLRKTSAALSISMQSEEQPTDRIEIVASEASPAKDAESQDSVARTYPEPAEQIDAEFTEIACATATVADEAESGIDWLDEQLAGPNEKTDANSAALCYDSDDYYEAIAGLIESELPDHASTLKTILMGAEYTAELPVTMPINIAMCLAQNDLRCLLVDLDPQRNSIAKVFDIDTDDARTEETTSDSGRHQGHFGIGTCVDNLSVLPASDLAFSGNNLENRDLKHMLSGLERRYDRVILYAPNLRAVTSNPLSNLEQIADCIQIALPFSSQRGESEIEDSWRVRFRRVLESRGCKVLNPTQTFMAAVQEYRL